RLVQDLRGKGSAMRPADLARYFAAEREPVHATYRGNAVFSSAPPAGGGALLAGQLNNLERFGAPRPYADDAASLHAMIAAWQLAPSSRNRIADPSLWPVNLEPFVNKDTAAARWRCFSPTRALDPAVFRGDTLRCPDGAVKPESLGSPGAGTSRTGEAAGAAYAAGSYAGGSYAGGSYAGA